MGCSIIPWQRYKIDEWHKACNCTQCQIKVIQDLWQAYSVGPLLWCLVALVVLYGTWGSDVISSNGVGGRAVEWPFCYIFSP